MNLYRIVTDEKDGKVAELVVASTFARAVEWCISDNLKSFSVARIASDGTYQGEDRLEIVPDKLDKPARV